MINEHQTLRLISIQHELAMAIGNAVDLSELLLHFFRVCLQRLNLTSCHAFLYTDKQQSPQYIPRPSNLSPLHHYLSLPQRHHAQLYANDSALQQWAAQCHQHLLSSQEAIYVQDRYYGFQLPQHGLVIFESSQTLHPMIQKALIPILNKLANSCYTAIIHQQLMSEMQARQAAEQTILFHANHDTLTSLCNRRQITLQLEEAIEQSTQAGTQGALLFIDLDQFKAINDSMGHNVGDAILQQVAQRLRANLTHATQIARFGGDEFVILLDVMQSDERAVLSHVVNSIQQINQALEMPFLVNSQLYHIGCSIGYSLFPHDTACSADIIKFADLAMYQAKRSRNKQGCGYQTQMSDELNKRINYVTDIKQGLSDHEFELYYQPQFNVQHQLIGAEALLRWHSAKHGWESPAVYIPIAEESDLILEIGHWVIQQACQHLALLQQHGLPSTFQKLAINVSAKQLDQDNFLQNLTQQLTQHQVAPQYLGIEITENLLIGRMHEVIRVLTELNQFGITCSIDDFGTGYSSLSYLKKIPASMIKIDRAFVTNIHQEIENQSIAKMIIALGENLDMQILAEGVETAEELACLKALNCHQYQGYFFSKPIPFSALQQLIAEHKTRPNPLAD